jgi:hypothetical protein
MGEVRKALGAVQQIRKGIEAPMKKYDEVNVVIQEKLLPFQEKVSLLAQDEKLDEKERAAIGAKIQAEANVAVKSEAKKIKALDEKHVKEIIEIELDANYKSLIKTNWEKLRKNYLDKAACVEVADALGID